MNLADRRTDTQTDVRTEGRTMSLRELDFGEGQEKHLCYVLSSVKYFVCAVYKVLHQLEHTSDPKKAVFQGHCLNKLDVKL